MVRGAWLYSELTSVRGGNNCGELRVLNAVSDIRIRVCGLMFFDRLTLMRKM